MIATFDHGQFSTAELSDRKRGLTVSVCIAARDEAETIGDVVTAAVDVGLVDEVVVVDDGSSDDTADAARRAGARVTNATDGPGKGQAMWHGLRSTTGDVVVFLDGDVRNVGTHFVVGLLGPLLTNPNFGFVKAFYRRPLDGAAGEGGRVNELLARPLLARLFPQLADVRQPLAGECAARREVLEEVPFVEGYGVEFGLLIDVATRYGTGSIAQVDLGERVHRNRSLAELTPQAAAVLDVALDRSGVVVGIAGERPPVRLLQHARRR